MSPRVPKIGAAHAAERVDRNGDVSGDSMETLPAKWSCVRVAGGCSYWPKNNKVQSERLGLLDFFPIVARCRTPRQIRAAGRFHQPIPRQMYAVGANGFSERCVIVDQYNGSVLMTA